MKVFLRIYAGSKYGFGHAIRSIAIAEELRKRQSNIQLFFLVNNDTIFSNIISKSNIPESTVIYDNGESEYDFVSNELKKNSPKILFLDNTYQYSLKDIISFKEKTKVILFHNLTIGLIAADLTIMPIVHLHPSFYENPLIEHYGVNLKHGAKYIALNPEVLSVGKKSSYSINSKPVVSCSSGGSDPEGVLLKLMEFAALSNNNVHYDFLVGKKFIHKDKLKEMEALLLKTNTDFDILEFSISRLMQSDIAISAFGVTTYELMYCGVPVITISHSHQTASSAKTLYDRYNKSYDLGYYKDVGLIDFQKALDEYQSNNDKFKENATFWSELIDSKGVERVVDEIINISLK